MSYLHKGFDIQFFWKYQFKFMIFLDAIFLMLEICFFPFIECHSS